MDTRLVKTSMLIEGGDLVVQLEAKVTKYSDGSFRWTYIDAPTADKGQNLDLNAAQWREAEDRILDAARLYWESFLCIS